MSTPRDDGDYQHDQAHDLVHGEVPSEIPGVPHGFGHGVFQAFELWGRLDRALPAAWAELDALWTSHADEIRAHTPDGEAPWIERTLREAGVIP